MNPIIGTLLKFTDTQEGCKRVIESLEILKNQHPEDEDVINVAIKSVKIKRDTAGMRE